MRKLYAVLVFVLFCSFLSAQPDTLSPHQKYVAEENDSVIYVGSARAPRPLPKNLVYAELAGSAFLYSFGYGRNFWVIQSKLAISPKAGFSIQPSDVNGKQNYLFPVEGNVLVGDGQNFFELGAGIVLFSQMQLTYTYIPRSLSQGFPGAVITHELRVKGINVIARIGYCYIPPQLKSLTLRVGITPIFYSSKFKDPFLNPLPWGGFSFGYAF